MPTSQATLPKASCSLCLREANSAEAPFFVNEPYCPKEQQNLKSYLNGIKGSTHGPIHKRCLKQLENMQCPCCKEAILQDVLDKCRNITLSREQVISFVDSIREEVGVEIPNLQGVNLSALAPSDVDLSDVDLSGVDLSGVDFSDVNLSHANLRDANLRDADLSGAYLRGADLRDADLFSANLSHANLFRAYLRDAYLSGAYLYHVKMSYQQVFEIAHTERDRGEAPNFQHADLSRIDLRGAKLSGAKLSGANLSHVNLRRADLSDADLSGANLSGADLFSANLSGAKLSHVKLSRQQVIDIAKTAKARGETPNFQGAKLPALKKLKYYLNLY